MIEFETYEAEWKEDSSGSWVSFKVHDKETALKTCQKLEKNKVFSVTIKEKKKHRSLDANAYFWVLCGKLAAKLNQPVDDVYRHLVRNIGDNFYVYPIKEIAADRYIEIWQRNGLGWVCDKITSKLPGYVNVVCYYGSSVYDTAQMSRLIDSVIQECEIQGIPTISEEEASKLKGEWKNE